jgi:hypothetical protein
VSGGSPDSAGTAARNVKSDSRFPSPGAALLFYKQSNQKQHNQNNNYFVHGDHLHSLMELKPRRLTKIILP